MTDHPHAALDLRAVDALVAEKIMGLREDTGDRWTYGEYESDFLGWKAQSWIMLPRYTTSWEAAGQVMENLARRGVDIQMRYSAFTGEWTAVVGGLDASADTFPLACSLAALAALGVEVPANP